MANPAGHEIDISSFSVEQLAGLQRQLKDEVEALTNNMNGMKVASTKYQQTKKALEDIVGQRNKPMLVPLTSSLYIPGQLASDTKVMVDIGTNYFVSMAVSDAQALVSRKIELVEQKTEEVISVLEKKRESLETVSQLLQERMEQRQAIMQQQQQIQRQMVKPTK